MTPFWKTRTFWISVCAWLVSMGGQYAEVIPSPYGLVAGNAVAIVYAVMRCLQKRQAGIPWKGIFFTSEFIGTSATVLVNFLESLKNVPALSPRTLAIVSTAIVGLGSLLHTVGGAKSQSMGDDSAREQSSPMLSVGKSEASTEKIVPRARVEDPIKH